MFSNWINDLFSLSDQIFGLMEKTASYSEFDVEAQDSRLVALSGMQKVALSSGFWLNTYRSIAEGHQDESMILKYAGSNVSIEKTSKLMLHQIKLGLVVFFHFKLENFLGNLVEEILKVRIISLGKMFKELAAELDLDDIDNKAACPRQRNCNKFH